MSDEDHPVEADNSWTQASLFLGGGEEEIKEATLSYKPEN